MTKFMSWLDSGITDTIDSHWTGHSVKQYFKRLFFAQMIAPIILIRFLIEPLHVAGIVVGCGLFSLPFWIHTLLMPGN